ncbi:MAG: TIGR02186 family protein [Hyphomicrobiaceae bacterium]
MTERSHNLHAEWFPIGPTLSLRSLLALVALALAIFVCTFVCTGNAKAGDEKVQADISTRTVAITSNFTGTEIIVFGAITNIEDARYNDAPYDVVVVVEGVGGKLVTRRKSNIAGIWINTQSISFNDIPSYYAIASTRPLDEITEPLILDQHGIGFEHISMVPARGSAAHTSPDELANFQAAVVRLKQRQGLYVQNEFGVIFVGQSLFRTTIDLPANVPVGPLTASVHVFREGVLLDSFESQVQLEREGVGRFLYNVAIGYPLLYGIAAVFVAAGAGWAASAFFSRRRS